MRINRFSAIIAASMLACTCPFPSFAEEDPGIYTGEPVYTGEVQEEEAEELPDLSQGFPFYNNPKKPAPMGIWLKAYRLSYEDSDDHEVYFRVKTVRRSDDQVNADIQSYNSLSTSGYIGDLEDENLEYCEIEYDVYYPEDFFVGERGYIVDPTLAFSIANPQGGGFITSRGIYVGLSKVQPVDIFPEEPVDTTEEDEGASLHVVPGEVFHGKSIFAMLKEEDNFVLQYACRQSEPDGQVIYQYSRCSEETGTDAGTITESTAEEHPDS